MIFVYVYVNRRELGYEQARYDANRPKRKTHTVGIPYGKKRPI
jgi:hypothetical protein